jgi:hypothetical protein
MDEFVDTYKVYIGIFIIFLIVLFWFCYSRSAMTIRELARSSFTINKDGKRVNDSYDPPNPIYLPSDALGRSSFNGNQRNYYVQF